MVGKMRYFGYVLAAGLFLHSGLAAVAQEQQPEALPLEELQVFTEVFGKLKSEYIDPVDDATLLRNAIEGMLNGMDPHSAFLGPEEFDDMRISTEGKFGGLGIEVTAKDGFIRVVSPIDDTPAHAAGIMSGDIITMLDDEPIRGISLKDAVDRMRGKPGTKIKLTIFRQTETGPIEVTLTRAVIKVASVKGEMLEEGFGYVRVTRFQKETAENLHAKIKEFQRSDGQPLKGLILDLRNNPGGILGGAVQISDMFLEGGEIVSTRGRRPDTDLSYMAKPDDVLDDAPMVVLVNGGSASASEIVAGALQDHQRAIILGTRTFGKGSVQTVIPMNNGGALKLTIARYYTPSNRSIQAKGIVPDIVAEQKEVTVAENSRSFGEADLVGHLQNESDSSAKSGEGRETVVSLLLASDYQLQEALNVLKGMNLVKLRANKGS